MSVGTDPALSAARASATFPTEALTVLWDGDAAQTARRREARALILADPAFDTTQRPHWSREQRYAAAVRMGVRVHQLAVERARAEEGASPAAASAPVATHAPGPISRQMRDLLPAVNELLPFTLHDAVFVPALAGLCSPEQWAQWGEAALSKRIIGAYAQTELGHGSDVAALETLAVFDPAADEIVLCTPTLTATKWWSGCLGKTATHAVVFAQLVVGGQRRGVHPFLVQVRSLHDHTPMPGVTVGDIGPKWGTDGNDNGFLQLDHVRIPRTQMLQKHARLSAEGVYTRSPHDKLAYGTMVFVRSNIVLGTASYLAKAVTIAVRYSIVRRQFKFDPAAPSETQVIHYRSQQFRLFPLVAFTFACRFMGQHLRALYEQLSKGLNKGDFTHLAETHALSAGLKSYVTTVAFSGIEECRRCCGGHGYSRGAGLVDLLVDFVPLHTAEGDNWLLTQQTAKYLLKMLSTGKPAGSAAYLADPSLESRQAMRTPADAQDSQQQLHLLSLVVARMAAHIGQRLQQLAASHSPLHAWNHCLVDVYALCHAHCRRTILATFQKTVAALRQASDTNQATVDVLAQLCNLLGLHWIVEHRGDAALWGGATAAELLLVHDALLDALPVLAPNMAALVDAFDFNDRELGSSCLGAYDGRVYERLMEFAQRSPLNTTQVVEPVYTDLLRPLLHSRM